MDAQIIEWKLGRMEEQKASEAITQLLQKGYRVSAYGTAAGEYGIYAWILLVKQ